jgi:hypothetical protein
MKSSFYFAIYFFVVFTLTSCFLFEKEEDEAVKLKGCTNPHSFNYNAKAEINDGSCMEMYGCLGYASGATNSGSLGVTLNNPVLDQKMNEEVLIQRNFFNGIPAAVFILYEPSPEHKNAYANSNGQILFGYYMAYYTIQNYGELPIAGILAHEWGHRAQFTIGWKDYYRPEHKELEADAFSGFYMALAKQYAWSQIQSYFQNVYATGDYNFNSPLHHGTPEQRLQAAYLGVNIAIYALQNGIQYNYNQLHELIFNEIRSKIAPRFGINSEKDFKIKNQFKEVEYPKNLTKTYIESLYPKK